MLKLVLEIINDQKCIIILPCFTKILTNWFVTLQFPSFLQELVELVMVGEAAAMSQGKPISTDGEISDLFTDYALVLATQGDYQTALCYLQHTQGVLFQFEPFCFKLKCI